MLRFGCLHLRCKNPARIQVCQMTESDSDARIRLGSLEVLGHVQRATCNNQGRLQRCAAPTAVPLPCSSTEQRDSRGSFAQGLNRLLRQRHAPQQLDGGPSERELAPASSPAPCAALGPPASAEQTVLGPRRRHPRDRETEQELMRLEFGQRPFRCQGLGNAAASSGCIDGVLRATQA